MRLISSPLLALPYEESRLTLDTVACEVQVGFLPALEERDETIKPIGYLYCFLTRDEGVSNTTQQECLAIVCVALPLHPRLEQVQSKFSQTTNNKNGL